VRNLLENLAFNFRSGSNILELKIYAKTKNRDNHGKPTVKGTPF